MKTNIIDTIATHVAVLCEGAIYCSAHSAFDQADIDDGFVVIITKDDGRLPSDACCTVCGKVIYSNQYAIVHLEGLIDEAKAPVNHGSYVIGSTMLNTQRMQDDYIRKLETQLAALKETL